MLATIPVGEGDTFIGEDHYTARVLSLGTQVPLLDQAQKPY